jgi:hypothetical protein
MKCKRSSIGSQKARRQIRDREGRTRNQDLRIGIRKLDTIRAPCAFQELSLKVAISVFIL